MEIFGRFKCRNFAKSNFLEEKISREASSYRLEQQAARFTFATGNLADRRGQRIAATVELLEMYSVLVG